MQNIETFDSWPEEEKEDFLNLRNQIQEIKSRMSTVINMPAGTQVPTQVTPAKRTYRRRYKRSYKRYRGTRNQRWFSSLRRKFPSSEYGIQFVKRSDATRSLYGLNAREATADQLAARKTNMYYGRGLYGLKGMSNIAKKMHLGKRVLGAIGGGMTGGVGGAITGFMGRGEYEPLETNSLVNSKLPEIMYSSPNDETQSIIISGTEFLEDLYGAPDSGFNVKGYALNPGVSDTFSWLSQIAQNYEEYEFIQLIFSYEPSVDVTATNNANGLTGTLIMNTDYNPNDPLYDSKEEMMKYGYSSCRVVDPMKNFVECDPKKNVASAQKYTRTLIPTNKQDLQEFDLGIFQIAQVNIPSSFQNSCIGELHVTYTVKLSKPKLSVGLLAGAPEFRCVSRGGLTKANLLGNNPCLMTKSMGIVPSITSADANQCSIVLTFPDFLTGFFECQLFVEGTGLQGGATPPISINLSGNVSAVQDIYASPRTLNGAGLTPVSAGIATDSAQWIAIARVDVRPVIGITNNVVTFACAFNSTSPVPSQVYVVVRQVNSQLGLSRTIKNPQYVDLLSGAVVDPAN